MHFVSFLLTVSNFKDKDFFVTDYIFVYFDLYKELLNQKINTGSGFTIRVFRSFKKEHI